MIKKLVLSSLLALSVILPINSYAFDDNYKDYINANSWALEWNFRVPLYDYWGEFNYSRDVFADDEGILSTIDSFTNDISNISSICGDSSMWAMSDDNYQFYYSENFENCSNQWEWISIIPQQYANVFYQIWYPCANPEWFWESSFNNNVVSLACEQNLDSKRNSLALYQKALNNPTYLTPYVSAYNLVNWWGSEWWSDIDTSWFFWWLSSSVWSFISSFIPILPKLIIYWIAFLLIFVFWNIIKSWLVNIFTWKYESYNRNLYDDSLQGHLLSVYDYAFNEVSDSNRYDDFLVANKWRFKDSENLSAYEKYIFAKTKKRYNELLEKEYRSWELSDKDLLFWYNLMNNRRSSYRKWRKSYLYKHSI